MKKRWKILIALLICAVTVSVGAIIALGQAEPSITVEKRNLAFAETVYLSYAVRFDNLPSDTEEKGILVWDEPHTEYNINTAGYTKLTKHSDTADFGNGTCYVYDYKGVAAKEMTDSIYVVGYIKAGGEYTYSELSKYSILQYAYNKLGYTGTPTSTATLAELLQAMLEYGGAAQEFFGYNTENLATAKYYLIKLVGATLDDAADNGLYREGVEVAVSAPPEKDGKYCAGVTDACGRYVSFLPSFTYKIPAENSTLTAVYSDTNLNYVLNGGTLADTDVKEYNPAVPTELPTPKRDGFVFAGWYTSQGFDKGTRITSISPGTAGVVTLFARWQESFFEEDFTDESFSLDSTSSTTVGNISYGLTGKTDSTASTVTDASGNTYVKIVTVGNDATINNTASITKGALKDKGKITFTLDIAAHKDGTSGPTDFRLRAGGTSDLIVIFKTKDGEAYLGGDTEYPIFKLSTSLQKLRITLDIEKQAVTAYDAHGNAIATREVSAPASTGFASINEWLSTVGYLFNWQMSAGGGIVFDNFSIYAGDYIVDDDMIPGKYYSISYETNGGVLPEGAILYYDSERDNTLPVPTRDGYVFSGWYTTPSFDEGTRIEKLSAGTVGSCELYARWAKLIYKNDLNSTAFTLTEESTGAKGYDGISYDNKLGVLSTTVADNGGYYVKVSTPKGGNDASVNHNITKGSLKGLDKITFEIDLAKIKDTGSTTFRIRGNDASDTIPVFTTSNGAVYIGGGTTKIADLAADKFTRAVVTLDIKGQLLTAYREGELPVFSAVSVPAASSETSLENWIAKVGVLFNWYIGSGGGIAFDNILIYGGDYIGARDISEEEREMLTEQIKDKINSFEYDPANGVGTHTRLDDESKIGSAELKKYNSFTAALGSTPTANTHPRLMLNAQTLADIIKAYNDPDYARLKSQLYNTARMETDGKLPAPVQHTSGRIGFHNYDANILYALEAKALMYLITGEELYGYEAILGIKNYLNTLDIGYINSDQCREYGSVMFVAAEVYDWCYELLTAKDKDQIATGVEYLICRGTMAGTEYSGMCGGSTAYDKYMEVGFPPSGQGSVSGHGSEAQILRDYLAIAIAIYDEDPTWYNYIAGRVYKDYVAFRNAYYTTGLYPQGTGCYANHRFPADLYSAWILEQMPGGANPYIDNMESIALSLIGHYRPDGKMFVTGDGSASTLNTAIALMTGALYRNPELYTYGIGNISPSLGASSLTVSQILILASRDTGEFASLNKAGDLFDSLSPVVYNGSYVGQIISRSEWNDPDAPAVFMKIGERSTANHDHADAGTFQIYYKGMLTGDTGLYAGYGTDHHYYYHKATVSHNGLLIYNPAKKNEHKGWYSGGQNVPSSEASTLDVWKGNDTAYKTGEVLGYEYGYKDADGKRADYAYITGNIAPAYAYADAASYVGRSMLTVYTDSADVPMIFVTFDRITATDASFEKTYLLHTVKEPTIDGNTVTVDNGKGKLVFTSLTDAVISKDGGAGRGFLVNGVQCAASTGKDDENWGRVELKTSGSLTSNFFNVMYVTDSDSEASLAVEKITASGVEAARAGDYVFGFVNSEERRPHDVTLTAGESGKSIEYFVGGLAAGEWQVKVDGSVVTTVTVTEEGGLAHFEAMGAAVTLTRLGA